MAIPAPQDLTFTRGDTEVIAVTVTTDGTTAVDITGRTYTSQLRVTPDTEAISATATCAVTDGPAGKMTATFSATATGALDPGFYYWDLQENASGVITTIMSGTVQVNADITR